MIFFDTDLSTLEEGESMVIPKEIAGISYYLYMSRKLGSMPLPMGCSSIEIPVEIATTENYWFAALFKMHKKITQPDFLKLYLCIAGFLPLFEEKKLALESVSLDCFQVSGSDIWSHCQYPC